ncbi:response regulator [Flavobacterium psychrotrophum]|uniref:response regulator n=1 Tax=Flavobacterium psychrotrophum TaxID=2294119 RepID=UPI000E31108A|nr:response regulator [Flavobacterium psychrotrophum]
MNILLVDDHPFTVEGYKSVMEVHLEAKSPRISTAAGCREAYDAIMAAGTTRAFDLAIIDHNLPAFEEKKLASGADVALLIRKVMPSCKIVMITAHTEILVLYDIYKKIEPEGFITKNELTPQKLGDIALQLINGDTYKSPIVNKSIREVWTKELMIDDINRQILFFMAKGYKAKELDELVFLSDSSIQKRIASMKKAFGVTDNSSLVKEAIQQGFL